MDQPAKTTGQSHQELIDFIREHLEEYLAAARIEPVYVKALRQAQAGVRVLSRHEGCYALSGYCGDGGHVGTDDIACAELLDLASWWRGRPGWLPAWDPEA